ncbi:hypothetical protein GN958_ATG09865, partial [Phytophthora infestans]
RPFAKYLSEAEYVNETAIAKTLSVHRLTCRWKRQCTSLEKAAQKSPNKCHVSPSILGGLNIRRPVLERSLYDWVIDIRNSRSLCVSTKCSLLMLTKLAPKHFPGRTRAASLIYIRRFLQRNRLTIRLIAHKGSKKWSDVEDVGNLFNNPLNIQLKR